jgi:hypothetical protein
MRIVPLAATITAALGLAACGSAPQKAPAPAATPAQQHDGVANLAPPPAAS